MAKVKLDFGAELDVLTKGELDQSLAGQPDALVRSWTRGIKHIRLPRLRGQASGGALTLGIEQPQSGPDMGFAWSIQRLTVTGLTTGAGSGTPDIINLLRSGTGGDLLWQLNGDNLAYTFGKGQITLYGGDTLVAVSVGTFAATGVITLSGEAWEVPAEMMGKLA